MPISEKRRHDRIPRVQDVVDMLADFFPPQLAEEWDNVGLNLGDPAAPVKKIFVSLDPSPKAIARAAGKGGSALVCHHPLLGFEQLKRLDFSTPFGNLIAQAIHGEVAVIAAHTNADWGIGGTNDTIAQKLGLVDVRPWETLYPEEFRKLVVFVPSSHIEPVGEAIFQAGGGIIGDYAKCSYRSDGHGTYLPQSGADPYAGQVGKLSVEPEIRLEVRVPLARVDAVVAAMIAAHPYEEVAFDLYPTERQNPQGGRARIGRLPRTATLSAFAMRAAKTLGVTSGRLIGDPKQPVSRVAINTGTGADLIDQLVHHPDTVLVTGDVKYHQACKARDHGLGVVDLGHYGTELPFVEAVVPRLRNALRKAGKTATVTACRPEGDPFKKI